MPKVHLGRKDEPASDLRLAKDLIVVRTRSRNPLARGAGPVGTPLPPGLRDAAMVLAFPEAGVEVFRVPTSKGKRSLDERKTELRGHPDVRFAGGVLIDGATGEPVLYTENLFVKFVDRADDAVCREVLAAAGLKIKEVVDYADNAFFVEAPEGTGRKVFEIAQALLKRDDVEYCHPELVRARARRAIFPRQWHLKKTVIGGVTIDAHADVEAAHRVTRGEGVIIAVIDDGVDIDHAEFAGNGKVVAPRDATDRTDDPRPQDRDDNHGTACAGVAAASGMHGASGVAPAAKLMPIRLTSGLGSQREADAFVWAARNGADVISCSWGPEDGLWWEPDDALHEARFQLPASTRLALDFVTSEGRGGKGCVVLFAAGNGNESADNDGYISYPKVIAVAACNDTGKRSVYSDFGKAVWCAFPSDDAEEPAFDHPAPLTTGIWTTDRHGRAGYNRGKVGSAAPEGDDAGDYTSTFGGTSSACPGAAGVVALVLAVNPALRWSEVKELLRGACDRIDPQGGGYNASGHSPKYGYGRLNAASAVQLARPQPRNEVTVSRRFDAPLPDLQTVSFPLTVNEREPVAALSVAVEIEHSFIGDLVVTLAPPSGAAIVLHDRRGGTRNRIKKIYDASTTPGLRPFAGRDCSGNWTLTVRDAAAQDSGTLVGWSLRLRFEAVPRSAGKTATKAATKSATKAAGSRPAARARAKGRKNTVRARKAAQREIVTR